MILFECNNSILDTICMEGSDDELSLEVELVQNPYYNHAAEFEDFEEIEGKMDNDKISKNQIQGNFFIQRWQHRTQPSSTAVSKFPVRHGS